MDDSQIEQLNSFIKSADVLNDYATELNAALPQHAPYEAQLDGLISQITEEAGLGEADTTGVKEDKDAKRLEVEAAHLKIANAAAAYYATIGDKSNRRRVQTTDAKLKSLRDSRLYIVSKQLVVLTTPIAANLINAVLADITALNNVNEEYFLLLESPKRATEEKGVHNASVQPLIVQAKEVRDTLTALMATLNDTANDFINEEWLSSLSIDDTGANEAAAFTLEGSVNANSVLNIDYSSVLISGSSEVKLTNNSAADMRFGFNTANNALANSAPVVSAGTNQRLTTTSLAYNAVTTTFLNIKNQTAGVLSFKVEIFLMD